jgi:hypothetical protein
LDESENFESSASGPRLTTTVDSTQQITVAWAPNAAAVCTTVTTVDSTQYSTVDSVPITATNQGSNRHQQKGTTTGDVTTTTSNSAEVNKDDSNYADEATIDDIQVASSTKHCIKRRWTSVELGAFEKAFENDIKRKKMPAVVAIKSFAGEINHSRTVAQIRTRLNNILLGKQKYNFN